MIVSRPIQNDVGLQELGGVPVLVHRHDFATGGPPCQRRVILDGETVEREVIGPEREGALQIQAPIAFERRGQPEDEVERQLRDAGVPKARGGGSDLLRAVGPVHPGEHRRIERLRAERDAVDPAGPPLEARPPRVTSSGLASSVTSAPGAMVRSAAIRSRMRDDGSRVEAGRRAAPEIHRLDSGRVRPRCGGSASRPIRRARHRQRRWRAPRAAPRWRNRSSCTAGRRRGRGGRRAPRKSTEKCET